MRNEIEDLINERLEALDEIDVVDSNNVNTVISSKVNEQNNKVAFSRKKQELIKILDKFKRINPNSILSAIDLAPRNKFWSGVSDV